MAHSCKDKVAIIEAAAAAAFAAAQDNWPSTEPCQGAPPPARHAGESNRKEHAMSLPSKILWSEGLTLGPQQFQQLDLYHEARLQRMAAAINPHLWGVCELKWNRDELANNTLRAETMSLIFQDGEIFDAPLSDMLPAAVDLSKLAPDEQSFTFYAALPILNPHGGNLGDVRHPADGNGNGARYAQADSETADLYTQAIHVDVSYLRKCVRLLSHLESRSAYIHFPVVRLRRLVSGGFEVDPSFMPPSLSLAAAGLQQMLDNLLGKLNVKIEALYKRHRQPTKHAIEVHSGDLASFWMLNTISSAGALLTHFARYRQHHPVALFERLMTLAGGLMTFSTRYALADLPAYRHDDPGPAFAQLDALIRDLVDTVISSKYFTIALKQNEEKNTHYRGELEATRVDRQTALCLAVNADMPALELVAVVPLRFKVGSPDDIERIIGLALPGIELVHMAQVPAEVPVRPNTYYFSIESKGALYDNMLKAQAIAIYVPTGIKGLRLELFGITP